MTQSRLPVSVLENNILNEFENRARENSHDIKRSVMGGKVVPELDLILDRVSPKGPSANPQTRKISLYESHLAYLWAFIYSSFVIYEEGVQKRLIDDVFNGELSFDTDILKRAKALQDWAFDFSHSYKDWDIDELPNPLKTTAVDEGYYIPKVNKIFLNSVSFLLFHEYGHLVLNHEVSRDRDWALAQEQDADNYATSYFINTQSTERERTIAGVSIVLLHASCVFMPEKISGIWQVKHPHLHDRIRNGISSLNLEEESSKFYIYYLASISLHIYLLEKGVNIPQLEMETAEELFFEYLEKIDELRESGI